MAEKNHRLCISCRKVVSRDKLWRVVRRYPDTRIQLDPGMGLSAFLCPQRICLEAAQKKNRLGRALRTAVSQDIYQALFARLEGVEEIPD